MFSLFRCKLGLKHRTDVDTQLSKFVVSLASVARQIHRRPLPPFPHPKDGFRRTGRTNSLQPTCAFGALGIAAFLRLSVVLLRGWSCKRRRGRLNPVPFGGNHATQVA
jgi:hypothetical protein